MGDFLDDLAVELAEKGIALLMDEGFIKDL